MTLNNRTNKTTTDEGRFSYDGLDRVIHEKARLGILTSLAIHDDGLVFNDLKQLCSLTDGNLSRHIMVLADAGLVETRKTDRGPRTQTMYRLSAEGRRRFVEYINLLETVVSDAHSNAKAEKRSEPASSSELSPG